jgi:hypothetical protein
MNRILAPLFILASLSFILMACGGGSSSPPPAISVTFSTPPPASIGLGLTANIAVTVSNDSANAGVVFSCTPAGSCGTFSAVTATTATYNSPAAVPSGGSVAIIATSVTDAAKNAQKTVTITGPPITISFTSTIPASLAESATLAVNVSLTNDTTNAGVTFTCAPMGSCGTFANPTAYGATYTAPATVPAGGTVTIIATSLAQASVSKSSTPITITSTASNASLKGQYAFLVLSPTGSRGTGAWVGSVNLDGNGGLAVVAGTNPANAGIEDVVTPVRNDQGDGIIPTAMNAASKYSVDASGHGQIVMATVKGELLTISFVITSANSSGVATHAEIIEADGAGGEAGDPGSGTLDLQDPKAFSASSLAHTYSFTMTGVQNAAKNPPESLGGVLNLSAPAAITGSVDIVSGGTVAASAAGTGSQLDNAPDANGRGTFHVVLPGASTTRSLTYYVVTSKVIRVFENSNISFTGGSMYSQGSPATTSLSGPYVYQHSGWSTAGRTVAAGQFSITAPATSFSGGISDANSGGLSANAPSTAKAVSGSFAASATETGTINLILTDAAETTASTFNAYPVDPALNILDPNATGNGGALLLHTDANINGVGLLLPQASPKVFSSHYALNLGNAIAASTPNEIDLVGILTSDGSSNFTANLADYTQASPMPNPMIGAPLSGTFAVLSGRYIGSFTVTSLVGGYSFLTGSITASATPATFSVAIYQATTSQAFVVETDAHAITTGQMVQQNLP